MNDAAPTPRRQPLAQRPWWSRALCVVCRLPIGRRESTVLGLPVGMVLVHDDCAERRREEVLCS